jgi:hypothetical protein
LDFYKVYHCEFISEELAIWETSLGEDRCNITWSKSRAERDRKTREDILDEIRKKYEVRSTKCKNCRMEKVNLGDIISMN